MSDPFDNMEYKTRNSRGDFPEEGEDVFQHRVVPVAEPVIHEAEEGGFSSNQGNRSRSAGKVRSLGPRSKRILRFGSAIGALLLMVYLGSKAYQVYLLSPEQLYAESFQPYVLGPPAPTDTGWSRFEIFYYEGSMDSIIRAARRKVILSDKETLIAGLAYLLADDPFWAIRPLKKLADQQHPALSPHADFYLSLAYLKNRDYDHALTVMLRIRRQREHPYRDKFPPGFIDRVKLLKWR
jgi:hypothetical protein